MTSNRKSPRRQSRPPGRNPTGRPLAGEEVTLEVTDVAHGGHCVARYDGRVVFVRHALPGEQVRARITGGTTTSRFLRADAIGILQAAPERVDPACPFSGPGRCGGCDWQHTTNAFQRELKTRVVREQLARLGGIDWDGQVEQVPGDQDGLRWRTRVEFAVIGRRLGLRAHRSHDVIAVDDCLIASDEIGAAGLYDDPVATGVTGVDVAVDSSGEVTAVDLPEDDEPLPAIVEHVAAASNSHDFEVSPRGFWQVHPGAAATFTAVVLDLLQPQEGEFALDLYSGVGLFSAFLADAVGPDGRVLGIEGDEEAAQYAVANLASYDNAHVLHGDVARLLPRALQAIEDVDLVVLDPPRTGAGLEVIEQITAARPRAIAYVACDPAALARDLRYATERGYEVSTIRAFDAFPFTHHVECIALLSVAQA